MASPEEVSKRFAALLAGDDPDLVQDVYERMTGPYDWSEFDELPDVGSPFRIVGDVVEADFLIGEAGFYTLVASHLVDLDSIPDSFDAIGARDAAETIRAVFASLPNSVLSSHPDTRYDLVNEDDFISGSGRYAHVSRTFDSEDGSGDDGYFDHKPEPWPLLAKYIRENAAVFARFFAETELPPRKEDPERIARHKAIAEYNAECEQLMTRPHVCPRCSLRHSDFVCSVPTRPDAKAYFVCRECGRSFTREELSEGRAN
jgi:hypothetical protein